MSGQMLHVHGSISQEVLASWAVESPILGVVLIDVAVGGPRSLTPLHWRAGDWTKPPIDIEINPDNGAVQGMQVVLQDEHPQPDMITLATPPVDEIPIVDTANWQGDRYRDVRCRVQINRGNGDELIVRFGESSVVHRIGRPGNLLFGWDASSSLCELVIGPLERQDWDAIHSFSGEPGARGQ